MLNRPFFYRILQLKYKYYPQCKIHMLSSISIKNFVLIDDLNINLSNGFTALTGETGAGKSIIIDALLIALGERANSKLLKDPSKAATVILCLQTSSASEVANALVEHGIDCASEIIIRRVIYPDGKTKAFINDTAVSATFLAGIREYLIEFCGQHDSKGLMNPHSHIKILDKYIGNGPELRQLSALYNDYKKHKNDLEELLRKNLRIDAELDFLNYAIKELEALSPIPEEESTLVEKRRVMQESAKASDVYHKASEGLNADSMLAQLSKVIKEMNKFPELFHPAIEACNRAEIEIEDATSALDAMAHMFTNGSAELEKVEDRLHEIRALARKYATHPDELYKILDQKKEEHHLLQNLTAAIEKIEQSLKQASDEYLKLAKKISEKRGGEAKKLESQIMNSLSDLKLNQADFKIQIESYDDTNGWKIDGIDSVKFIIRTNPGSQYGSLDKIASGGELSRIMLAIKAGLASVKSVSVLIFDEVDTGISGSVSEAVGKKIAELANDYQILTITHQPQVTAFCNNHLLIQKSFKENDTMVSVKNLSKDESIQEVARMLSGEEITSESVAAATKLISAVN